MIFALWPRPNTKSVISFGYSTLPAVTIAFSGQEEFKVDLVLSWLSTTNWFPSSRSSESEMHKVSKFSLWLYIMQLRTVNLWLPKMEHGSKPSMRWVLWPLCFRVFWVPFLCFDEFSSRFGFGMAFSYYFWVHCRTSWNNVMIQEKLSRIYRRCKDNVTLPWIMPLDEIQFRHSFAVFIVEIVLLSCQFNSVALPNFVKKSLKCVDINKSK